MDESQSVLSSTIGPSFEKSFKHVSKTLDDVNKESKKTNDLIISILRYLRSRNIKPTGKRLNDGDDLLPIVSDVDYIIDTQAKQIEKHQKDVDAVKKESKSRKKSVKKAVDEAAKAKMKKGSKNRIQIPMGKRQR